MNVLIIGSGGRETSIIKKLFEKNKNLHCIGTDNNPHIKKYTKSLTILKNYNDFNLKVTLNCEKNNIDYVVIGAEKYLELGLVDYLNYHNIKVIGPTKKLAQLETDKYYTRTLISNNNSIAKYNPKYKFFNSLNSNKSISDYNDICRAFNYDYVIKPVGLCSGKGVKVSKEHFDNDLEGLSYSLECISSNQSILIEEKINGDEYTLMTYTDGVSFSHMPVVLDYKRLHENNTGPNTGSMGCISYSDHKAPFLNDYDIKESQRINEEIIKILQNKEGVKYKGIVYGSFIKCKETKDIKIIEYNCRFGDPECVNVLELLETDLNTIFESIINECLTDINISYANQNIISKYVVPFNYATPLKCDNIQLNLNNEWFNTNYSNIIFSSANSENNILTTTMSRTLIYFLKSNKSLDCLSTEMNIEIDKLMCLTNNMLKYRRDIGLSKILTYKQAGVDIEKGNKCIQAIKNHLLYTNNETVVSKLNDFSGLISIKKYLNSFNGLIEPILVSSIDGVGTKTSFLYNIFGEEAFSIVGRDIVNHCVNDILTKGAKPLFFLDYIASSSLDIRHIEKIVAYMSKECKNHDCPLIGGETAEMPNIYMKDEIDIVGCMVGIVDKPEIINGPDLITDDDIIIAFPSHGLHTNGFSLVRKIHKEYTLPNDVISWLKQPHKSYYNEIRYLRDNNIDIYGICHITGGGLIDNPPRILPINYKIKLDKKYLLQNQFKTIQSIANLSEEEMYRTFNCGIGMLVFVSKKNIDEIKTIYSNNDVDYYVIGYVENRHLNEPQVEFVDI